MNSSVVAVPQLPRIVTPLKSAEVEAAARNSVPAGFPPAVHCTPMEEISTTVKVDAAACGTAAKVIVEPKATTAVGTPESERPRTCA